MVGAFALFCGLMLLLAWAYLVRDWFLSARWGATRGTVRGSLVEPAREADILRPRAGFRPVIRYAYEVDGQTYVGARFAALRQPFFETEEEAWSFADRFPVGSHVRVRVNPKNPRQTLLERRLSPMDALPGYLALAAILLGLLLL